MPWKVIPKHETGIWNEKLKNTDAVFYQFPYYASSEYNSAFSKAIFVKYIESEQEIAFAAIIEIGLFPFKVGIIEEGPVLLQESADLQSLIRDLKKFVRNKSYMHLQVRPPVNSSFNLSLKTDKAFENRVYFPFHLKVEFDLNIYKKPEKELLAGFKMQCRRKIVLAGRVPYKFFKINNEEMLADIRKLFNDVTDTKGYGFLPFKIYEAIYKEGKNAPDAVIASFKDITAIKAATEKLRKNEIMFRSFMCNSHNLGWVYDAEGNLVYGNPVLMETVGLSQDSIGKNIFDVTNRRVAASILEKNKRVLEVQ